MKQIESNFNPRDTMKMECFTMEEEEKNKIHMYKIHTIFKLENS